MVSVNFSVEAYLKEQTWLYRRNHPKDVAIVLGTPAALKRSLKTVGPKQAAARASELNLRSKLTGPLANFMHPSHTGKGFMSAGLRE
jgi:hypothetical protein